MATPTVRVDVKGARGESLGDIARRVGAIGEIPVPANTSDPEVLEILAVAAGVTPEVQALKSATELARDQAADLVRPENIFIDVDLPTAEAAVSEGTTFKIVDSTTGIATVYRRTASGSDELYEEATRAALGGDDGVSFISFLRSAPGAVLRSLADWFEDEVSVMDFIPLAERINIRLRTSTADLSYAFQAATDAAAARGGAVVKVPSGTYPNVQGITLREGVTYQGSGQATTIIRMPAVASAHMFSAEAAAVFDGGGFSGIRLDGRQSISTAQYDAISFAECDSLEEFAIDYCYIYGFRRGFHGSVGHTPGPSGLPIGNDRFPTIRYSRFQYNKIGIETNEHAIISFCDVRENDIGLTGRMNDLHAVYTKFVRNRIGVIGRPYPMPSSSNVLTNSDFTACVWYANTDMAAELGGNCTVIGGAASGSNNPAGRGGTGDIGFRLRFDNIALIGVKFGQANTSVTSFADAAVLFERDTTAGAQSGNAVQNCIFHLESETGVGIRSALGPYQFLYNSAVEGNYVRSNGRPFALFEQFQGLRYCNNRVYLRAPLPAGAGAVEWNSIPSAINSSVFMGNFTRSESMSADTHAFKGDARNLTFAYNTSRNFSAPFNVTNATLARWANNGAFRTEWSGLATITAGTTSITVNHTLSIPPVQSTIQVTPVGDTSGFSWWVSAVTDETFTINVSAAPSSNISFGWRAYIRGGDF